jgi:DNA-binding response OmpR family regulator
LRILVVQEDGEVARVARRFLEGDGFKVEVCANGDEALQLATATSYRAIVLDWNLPGLDGLSMLKKLRQAGRTTRVIFLSARNAVSDRVQALRSGADDYMGIPFSVDELRARLYALLRRPEALLDKLTVGDLELDRLRRAVIRGQADSAHTTGIFSSRMPDAERRAACYPLHGDRTCLGRALSGDNEHRGLVYRLPSRQDRSWF